MVIQNSIEGAQISAMKTYLCLVFVFGLTMFPSVTQGSMIISFDLIVSPGHYSAAAIPEFYSGDSDFAFETGIVSTADGVVQATSHTNGWSLQSGIFSTFDEMKLAVQQSWVMVLDQGLPTERNYTMSLDIDGLEESDIAPPTIGFPGSQETIQTLSPVFDFDLHIPRSHILTLRTSPTSGTSMTLAQTGVAPGITSWAPSSPLEPDSRYVFGLRTNLYFPEFGFSAPIDSSGTPLEDWDSHMLVSPETNVVFFTAVPEPGAFAMFGLGGAALVLWRSRSRRML